MEKEIRPDTLSVVAEEAYNKLTPAKKIVADKVTEMLKNEDRTVTAGQ